MNATALIFAGVGPVLWILYAWLIAREVDWRRALGVALRIGVLTLLTSLWWIAGPADAGHVRPRRPEVHRDRQGGRDHVDPERDPARPRLLVLLRQDRLGPWIEAAQRLHAAPVRDPRGLRARGRCALLAAAFLRWRHRVFFVVLLFVGVVIAVGAVPYADPTPLGARLQGVRDELDRRARAAQHRRARSRSSCSRSRCCSASAANVGVRRAPRDGASRCSACAVSVLVVLLIVVNFPALFDGTFYGKNLRARPRSVPAYWTQAIAVPRRAGRPPDAHARGARRRLRRRTRGATPSTRSRPASSTGRTSRASSSRTARPAAPTC